MTDIQPIDFAKESAIDFVKRSAIDSRRILSIIGFMKDATTAIDPEETLAESGITSIDTFSESQLTYFLVQAGVKNTNLKDLFNALNRLDTNDIRMINSDITVFKLFMMIAGGLYYAKSIRRLIKKADIIAVKKILTHDGYDFIFKFSKSKECLEDYPLTEDFEKYFNAIGYHILQEYFGTMNPIIIHYITYKMMIPIPDIDIKHLRISNQYALDLAIKTKNFIIEQSE